MAKDDRFRVPVDAQYANAIGVAAYAFARLEWSAVYVCERLQSGYVGKVSRKTAGVIATDLVRLSSRIGDASDRVEATGPALEFKRLVGRRNDLLHANPSTAPGGDQLLHRHGMYWTTAMV